MITRLPVFAIIAALFVASSANALQLKFNMDDVLGDASYFVGTTPTNYNEINWDRDLEDNDPLLAGVDGQSVADSIDFVSGLATGVSLTVTSATGFNEIGPNRDGSFGPGAPASGFFDAEATDTSLFGHSSNFNTGAPRDLVEYTIAGLNSSKFYDFTFFAARFGAAENRETQYDVLGTNTGVDFLDPNDNNNNIAQVLQVQPDGSGELKLTIQAGPNNVSSQGFFYLSTFDILENGDAPPLGNFPGDANGDGVVDLLDLDILGTNFGSTPATFAQGDFNGDNVVDLLDLDVLGTNFGAMAPSATSVPEPSALLLVLGAMLPLGRRRA